MVGIISFPKLTAFSFLLVAALGCGPLTNKSNGSDPAKETIFAIDGVKFISSAISGADDPRTYGQRTYAISGESRLLLRFVNLSAAVSRIHADKPVRIRVFAATPADFDRRASLQLCPVTRSWMMAATWQTAHPFRGGRWAPGGEIESEDCVGVEATSVKPTPMSDPAHNPCTEPGAICFNVTPWYNNYVIQRGLNYGVALRGLNGHAPVQVFGDAAGSKAPRIHWSESVVVR